MQNITLPEKAPGRSTQRTVECTMIDAATARWLSPLRRCHSLDVMLTNGGMKKG